MQVVQYHHQAGAAKPAQYGRGRLVQAETVTCTRSARSFDVASQYRGELRQHGQGPQYSRVEVGERVGERPERAVLLVLRCPATQHGQPPAASPRTELRQQPALADTGLPRDIDDRRTTLSQPLQHRIQQVDLHGPADERRHARTQPRPVIRLSHYDPSPFRTNSDHAPGSPTAPATPARDGTPTSGFRLMGRLYNIAVTSL